MIPNRIGGSSLARSTVWLKTGRVIEMTIAPHAPGCPRSRDFDPFGDRHRAAPAAAQAESGAVYFSDVLGWYVVTRHEDVRRVSSDRESFSSSIFSTPVTPLRPAAQATLDEHGFRPTTPLGALDEPLHLDRRRRIDEPFKAENVAVLEPRVREIWSASIDRFVRDGRADLVAQLAWEAPAEVALELMGVPEGDAGRLKELAAHVLAFVFGRPTEDEQVAVCELMGRQYVFAQELIARIRQDPSGPGLLPHAVRASLAEPEHFDDGFLVSLCINTLSASHETTSASLVNTLLELLRRPEAWDAICADPALVAGAVEEGLRFAPSLTTNRRLCIKDTVVGGVRIPAGAKVLLGVAAGNRDEAVFAEPHRFDVGRRNARRHLTFGYGAHFCLGAPVARLQLRIALEELTRRLPHMRLVAAQTFDYEPSFSVHTPSALLVEWEPEANPIPSDRPSRAAAGTR
jgi:cytochrome P450